MNGQNFEMALNQLPQYIKFTYTKHAIDQSLRKDRDVIDVLPEKITKDKISISKAWFDDNKNLVKVAIRIDIGLKNLVLEIIYLPLAKQVKTVYKTRK